MEYGVDEVKDTRKRQSRNEGSKSFVYNREKKTKEEEKEG